MTKEKGRAVKRCPFCGKFPVIESLTDMEGVPTGQYGIYCRCERAQSSVEITRDGAIEAWNKRSRGEDVDPGCTRCDDFGEVEMGGDVVTCPLCDGESLTVDELNGIRKTSQAGIVQALEALSLVQQDGVFNRQHYYRAIEILNNARWPP